MTQVVPPPSTEAMDTPPLDSSLGSCGLKRQQTLTPVDDMAEGREPQEVSNFEGGVRI
jgi:hypothetical protein